MSLYRGPSPTDASSSATTNLDASTIQRPSRSPWIGSRPMRFARSIRKARPPSISAGAGATTPSTSREVQGCRSGLPRQKGRDRITKKERSEIKEMVAKKLRAALAPTTRLFEVSWDVVAGFVRVFSHWSGVADAVNELFERTFFTRLTPESPYIAATFAKSDPSQARFQNPAHEAAWAALEPTIFVTTEGAL
ncbi:hypothetical protein OUZ56_032651 [Daphnia magna]|uniref:Uncharacterized protein n=1 Tax=Daphnia magna TaxID=35525 RepID=A0ABR0B9I4_9CRUS|nr:hypothetical protein OUZ56_032651 [Daphnia magna]